MNKSVIYIDGAAGTTGLQIFERLSSRKNIELIQLPEETRKSLPHRLQAVKSADVSMLCLPDAAAKELAAAAPKAAKICDASTAHRTNPDWVYGFAELAGRRKQLRGAPRVSVPGCHASGFLALVAPLVEKGLVSKGTPFFCTSLTGYSGGGKQMIAAYEAEGRPAGYSSPRQYALSMAHKHLPEMQAVAGLFAPPLFTPVVDDYYSGMLVSLPLDPAALNARHRSTAALLEFYQNYYAGEALIHVHGAESLPEDGTLAANALSGRDDMELFILGRDEQILLCARFDNLGKGAAGAAVQCLNLMLGLPETEGLRV